MSPSLIGNVEKGESNTSVITSPTSGGTSFQSSSGVQERNYMGLSDCSSVDSSKVPVFPEGNKSSLNLKATELRLGLPGFESPERDLKLDEKPLFPLIPSKDGTFLKTLVSGNKRGFSRVMDGFSEVEDTVFMEGNWMYPAADSDAETAQSVAHGKLSGNAGVNSIMSCIPSNSAMKSVSLKEQPGAHSQPVLKEILPSKGLQDAACGANQSRHNQTRPTEDKSNDPPAAKAQVVGWPPIRSFRKNTLASTARNNDEVDGKPGPGALFVKVSMDGAPYLRKVDLRTYSAYQELSSALEKMFSCFTLGQCASHGAAGKEIFNERRLKDLLNGSEYVLTYEDKDGDWMLVGDVPWKMFIESCKRMRIMKSSDAIGLAPRVMEKCKTRN